MTCCSQPPVEVASDANVGDPATPDALAAEHRVDTRRTGDFANRLDFDHGWEWTAYAGGPRRLIPRGPGRVRDLLAAPPDGRLILPTLAGLAEGVRELETRLAAVERGP